MWHFDSEAFWTWVLVAITVGVLAAFLAATVQESRDWERFQSTHNCKVAGQIKGELFNTITANGQIGIGATSDKTGWLCDDGVTYYR